MNSKDKSTGSSTNSKSIQSICSHEDRKYDTIPYRIDFIKYLLEGTQIEPIIDFDNNDTENFLDPNGCKNYNENFCNNTKYMLNKKLYNFYKVINQIGGRLFYIKSGSSGHTFMGSIKENENELNYAVKVVAYPKRDKYGKLYNIKRPENAELMMMRCLAYFVVNEQTPHIALPVFWFDTSIKPFINLIDCEVITKSNKKYIEFVENYKKGEYYDYVSVLVGEWANRGDLLDFIKNNYLEFKPIDWKVLFFQIISVLAVIQNKYPSFRHNDLKANNILVHQIKKRGTIFCYTVVKKEYYIPNIGYMIKLWDFDFASIPGIIDNNKVNAEWTTQINIGPKQNRYYDIHYFFNTLIKKGFFPQFMTSDVIPLEAKEFVKRMVPLKYQIGDNVAKKGRILIDEEYKIPDEILRTDPYFENFRNPKKRKN